MKTSTLHLLFFLLLLPLGLQAQNYPVQATFNLTPPYGIRLSDYSSPANQSLRANVWLKDLNQPELAVRFKVKIEELSGKISLQSKPNYLPEPMYIMGGQPEMLDASQLGHYYDLANLQVIRGSLNSITTNGGKLPDGVYRFSLQVLEYYTGRLISNTPMQQVFLTQSDPPQLLLPQDNQRIQVQEPQYIAFSWSPRHLGSPNRPQNVTYRFQVVELLRDNQTAGDAFATTMPIVDETNIMASAYQMGPADSPLIPGQWYAWRVQAYDEDEMGLLKNNGWSEMRRFQYGVACTECGDLLVETVTPSRVELSWTGEQFHQGWEVRYRPVAAKGESPQEWRSEEFLMERANVRRLSPAVEYEFQVRGKCGTSQGEWTQTVTATTGEREEKPYLCEGGELVIQWDNNEPLTTALKVGDTFFAADFEVTVTSASLNGNTHSGEGMIQIKSMNNVFFGVTFDQIELNTDYKLIKGNVEVTGADSNLIDPELADAIMKGVDALDDLLKEAEAIAKIVETIKKEDEETATKDQALQDAKKEKDAAKEALKTAEDELKEAKKSGDEKAIAAAEEKKEAAKDRFEGAKDAQKQAQGNVIKAITEYFGKGSKELLAFVSGVNRCIQAEKGMVRQQEAEATVEKGKAVLAFLTKMDGQTEPDINLRDYAGLSEEEALTKCSEMAAQVVSMLDGQTVNENTGKTEQEAGVLTAIKQARTAVYLFQQIFGLGYDMLANDDALREKNCDDWSKTATLTFTKNTATAFDAGGRGFDDAVFDGLDCEGPTKLYPFIAIEKGQKGKVNYTTDSQEKIFFRPVNQKANVISGSPQGTELFALDGKKTLWEAYTSVDNQDQILGKINVLPFEPKTIKLYIKPVDDIEAPTKADVENYLASVYGDYFINFEVVILGKMTGLPWDENGDGKLASGDGEHGSLATYTSEQRTLISAFKKVHQRGKDELVAFWAPAASKAGLKGFFPQGRAYGFIYAPDNSETTFHTLAHELGHGAFNLQHPFVRFKGQIEEGDTDNLMDYGKKGESPEDGLKRKSLYAYQWPLLHKPLKVLGIEKSDGDSEIITESDVTEIARLIREISCMKGRGETFALAEFSRSMISVSVGSLLDRLEINGFSELRNQSLTFIFPHGGDEGLRNYNHYAVDLTNGFGDDQLPSDLLYRFGNSSNALEVRLGIVVNGEKSLKEFIKIININNAQKVSLLSLFESLIKANSNLLTPQVLSESGSGIDTESLALFTRCDFENITVEQREMLFEQLAKEHGDGPFIGFDDDTKQLYSVKLLETIPEGDRSHFFIYFEMNPEKLIASIEKLDGDTKERFNQVMLKFWNEEYQNHDRILQANYFVGATVLGNLVDKIRVKKVDGIYGVYQIQQDGASFSGTGGYSYYRPSSPDVFIGSLFSPVHFSLDTDTGAEPKVVKIPAILLATLSQKGNMDHQMEIAMLTLDAVSLVVGIGEITMAYRALKTTAALTRSSYLIAGRLALGMADVSATALDVFCKVPENQDCELCHTWKDYGVYLQLGLVSASMVDMFTGQMVKSLDNLPAEKVDDLVARGAMPALCFPAGTMIYRDGKPFKKIEDIQQGDSVESFFDVKKHQQDYVLGTSNRMTDSLIHIFVGQQKLLSATPEHPIFTPAQFKRARDLIEGDSIYHISGKFLSISKIECEATNVRVYNFEVADNHTYFAEGIGVHNSCIQRSPALESKLADLNSSQRTTLIQTLEESPSLLLRFNGKPELVDAWKKIRDAGFENLCRNTEALNYVDGLKTANLHSDGYSSFSGIKNEWNRRFPETVNPNGTSKLIRHHAIEQQVLKNYPGVISLEEMHSISNLRGIPKEVNSDIHLRRIRELWDDFYDQFNAIGAVPTKKQLLEKATEIDNIFGNQFFPPIR